MGWNRRRSYALVGFAAVAGLLLAVVPAFGDSHPDAVRLHLGTDGEYFEYEDTRQNLTSTRCEINELDGPVMALDANRKVGLNSFGIGVKSGGAQGTPCGRVEAGETLTLSVSELPESEGGVLEGRFFDGARLDLELKGDARVIATLHNDTDETSKVFELGSGSSIEEDDVDAVQDDDGVFRAESTKDEPNVACGAASDSGPDSGARDNCLWTITPSFEFNRIVLSAEVGEFSLEGSGDYGNDPAFDSLFYIANAAPVAVDDVYSTPQNTELTVNAPGVLGNDTDANDDPLTAVLVGGGPSNGSLSPATDGSLLASDGSFTYTPNTDFVGSDSFTYRANDGTDDSNIATVMIKVTLDCDENTLFSGEGEPDYTVRPENGGADCDKEVTEYDAGFDTDGNSFVKLITSSDTDTVVVFLELIEFEQVFSGNTQTPTLYYDDNLSNETIDLTQAQFCLVDPRDVDEDDEPIFDLAAAYDSATEAGAVLPTEETTCIISAEYVTVGTDADSGDPIVKGAVYVYNKDDGFRTFK